MNICGMIHVNINCSNFERSKRFYEALGFRILWQVPTTNSAEVAAAVGMPPYPHLYHLGLARLALETSDMDADLAVLELVEVHGARELIRPAGTRSQGK